MIRIVIRMAWVVTVAAALFASAALAQGGGRPGVPPRAGRGGDKSRTEDRANAFDEALDKLGLTSREKAAVQQAMVKKRDAHQELRHELEKLEALVRDTKATDQQLQRAMGAYRAAMERATRKLEAADRALAAKLSVKSQAKCLAFGLLDNGLGHGGGMGMRGGGGGREGGGRGEGGRAGGDRGEGRRGGRGGGPPRSDQR
jgi:hypothetical protein